MVISSRAGVKSRSAAGAFDICLALKLAGRPVRSLDADVSLSGRTLTAAIEGDAWFARLVDPVGILKASEGEVEYRGETTWLALSLARRFRICKASSSELFGDLSRCSEPWYPFGGPLGCQHVRMQGRDAWTDRFLDTISKVHCVLISLQALQLVWGD